MIEVVRTQLVGVRTQWALSRRFVAQESSGVTFFEQAESRKAAASSTVRVN